jgi:hypothetical protein
MSSGQEERKTPMKSDEIANEDGYVSINKFQTQYIY